MTELHRVRGEFAQNDAFLDLVTGLAAMLARFDALVAAHVPAAGTGVSDESAVIESPGSAGARSGADGRREVVIDLLLGAIALRAKLGERLAVGDAAREAVSVSVPVPRRELLR